ncbi:MAG: hypothetical protein JWO95_599 [Verrucomicrobiales bacterium]|nr:hypothetical protein [Verrucomicrobiales bacterium]
MQRGSKGTVFGSQYAMNGIAIHGDFFCPIVSPPGTALNPSSSFAKAAHIVDTFRAPSLERRHQPLSRVRL